MKNTATHYDAFFGPMYFEPYAVEIAKRLNAEPQSVVLELAAGTGRVTRHIQQRISPSARFIASDISEEMLSVAKRKLSNTTIQWQSVDAQQLPFSDNSVDMVICAFGYMFVPDKPEAFAEAYRVLKPGGQLLFTTWDKLENNGASYLWVSIAKTYLDDPLPESYSLSTSMHDETELRLLLNNAGFATSLIEKVQLAAICTTAAEAADGLASGAIYEELQKRNPGCITEIKAKLKVELAAKYGAAPMVAPMSAVLSQAWK